MANPSLPFVHLHAASAFSHGSSVLSPEHIAARAAKDGSGVAAMTDRGSLAGLPAFDAACRRHGVAPLFGVDVRMMGHQGGRLVLLAQTDEGVRTLYRHLTRAEHDRVRVGPPQQAEPELRLERLLNDHAGLHCLVSGPDSVLARGRPESASDLLARLQHAMPGAVTVGVARRAPLPSLTESERALEQRVVAVSMACGVPVVATTAAQCRTARDGDALLAMEAIRQQTTVASLPTPPAPRPLYAAKHLQTLFADQPQWVAAAATLAHEGQGALPRVTDLPRFPVPQGFADAAAYLRHLTETRLADRLGPLPAAYQDRLQRELQVLAETGFVDYMLIVGERVRSAKTAGVPVGPGRGSAAGSLAAFALGITDIDPVHYNLSFERFLNRERQKQPDIDIDVAASRRDAVVADTAAVYGHDRVARVTLIPEFRTKSAIDAAGVAFGLGHTERTELKRAVAAASNAGDASLADALQHPTLAARTAASGPEGQVLRAAARLVGLPSTVGEHPSAVVIGPRRLSECAPVRFTRDEAGRVAPVIQFPYREAEALGLLKIDLLSMPTFDQREAILDRIAARQGVRPNLDQLDLNDAEVYTMLRAGRLLGVFQLEGAATQRRVAEVQPQTFADLVALNALTRPGAMHLAPEYARRGPTGAAHCPPHPALAAITAKTRGLLLYQEQVTATFQVLGDYSAGEADLLRRSLEAADGTQRRALAEAFARRAAAKGHDPKAMEQLVGDVAGYGFCEAHAVAYSTVTYQMAWLKRHHPAEFHQPLLNAAVGRREDTEAILREARACGATVSGPSWECSDVMWSVEGAPEQPGTLRVGLGVLPGIKPADAAVLVAARDSHAAMPAEEVDVPFRWTPTTLQSVRATTRVADSTYTTLADAGALDTCFEDREHARGWAANDPTRPARHLVEAAKQRAGLPWAPAPPPRSQPEQHEAEVAAVGFQWAAPVITTSPSTRPTSPRSRLR